MYVSIQRIDKIWKHLSSLKVSSYEKGGINCDLLGGWSGVTSRVWTRENRRDIKGISWMVEIVCYNKYTKLQMTNTKEMRNFTHVVFPSLIKTDKTNFYKVKWSYYRPCIIYEFVYDFLNSLTYFPPIPLIHYLKIYVENFTSMINQVCSDSYKKFVLKK